MGCVRQDKVLHVGCSTASLPEWLGCGTEVRLDVVPECNPDIVANMTDMGDIGEFDCVYCCHALEHLHPDDVYKALIEFRRVLKPGGCAIVFVPDLEGVMPTRDVLFESPAGPITGLDLIYGYNITTKERPYMRHLTGFIKSTLEQIMKESGFGKIEVKRLGNYNMMGVAIK